MNKTILLADDDVSTRFVLSRALQQLGCHVVIVEDGADVPELLQAQQFDLLVIDLYMPGLNGFGVLRHLRETDARLLPAPRTQPGVPVLVVSGEGSAASIANAKSLGADEYLVKPLDLDVFEATVRRLVTRSVKREA